MNNKQTEEGEPSIDRLIVKLLEVCGPKSCKNANLTEEEITFLCVQSRLIFAEQPILLELEAPIKIAGMPLSTRRYTWPVPRPAPALRVLRVPT